jgi:uncharacterized protein
VEADLARLAAFLATGLAAGYASTLLGIGGGLVVVPVLHYVLRVGFVEATALSLLAMTAQTPFGLWSHARRGAVDWRLAAWLAAGGAAGVAAGILLQPIVPVPQLKLLFAAVMVLAAWRLWSPELPAAHGRPGPVPAVALGAVAGVASRLLGIGGGLVTVPALTLAGVAVHTAVATSLAPVFTNALLASVVILAQAATDWRWAVPLALGALVTAPLGTRTAHALDARPLRRVFAGAVVVAAAYVAWTALATP